MANIKSRIVTICMGVFVIYYLIKICGHVSTIEFVGDLFLLGLLIKLADRNMQHNLYEDRMTFPAMGFGVIINILITTNRGDVYYQGIGLSIAGLLLGGVLFYLIGFLGKFRYKVESVGGGDIKLAAAIGSFIGPTVVWFVVIWGCIWITMRYLFAMTFLIAYQLTASKRRGLTTKQRVIRTSVVPSAPIHLVALISTLLIKHGLDNWGSFFFAAGVVIAFALLFSFETEKA